MIEGILGLQGFGKTAFQVQRGLYLAEKFDKPIVANFRLEPEPLYEYLISAGCRNLIRRFHDSTLLYYVPYMGDVNKHISSVLTFEKTVMLLDESGQFFHKKIRVGMEILWLLKEVRKKNSNLLWTSQTAECVNDELFSNSEYIFLAEGLKIPSEDGYPILIQKHYKKFLTFNFKKWQNSERRGRWAFDRKMIEKSAKRPTNGLDLLLFKVYDSSFSLSSEFSGDTGYIPRYFNGYIDPDTESHLFRDYALSKSCSFCYQVDTGRFVPAPYQRSSLPLALYKYLSKYIKYPFYSLRIIKEICRKKYTGFEPISSFYNNIPFYNPYS